MHPILFHIGDFPIYSYGVMFFLAFAAAILLVRYRLSRYGVEPSSIYLLAALMAITGVIGARIFYVIGHFSEYSSNWGRLFDVNTAGMVFYGGLLFCIPVGIMAVKRMRLPLGKLADAVGLALPLSLAIARVGCFLNGCCGGKPTDLPWAVTFPGSLSAVHPTQVYEMILDLSVFFALLLISKRLTKDGDLLLLSIAAYGIIRFVMEFFRAHSNPMAAPFFQALSAAIVAVTAGILLYRHGFRVLPFQRKALSKQ